MSTPAPDHQAGADFVVAGARELGLACGLSADVLAETLMAEGGALFAALHGREALVAFLQDMASKIELSGATPAGNA